MYFKKVTTVYQDIIKEGSNKKCSKNIKFLQYICMKQKYAT